MTVNNCGIGPGGFQPGNTCAKGGGGGGVAPSISTQLKNYSYESIKDSKKDKIQEHLRGIAKDLGIKTTVNITPDTEFDREIQQGANKAGVSPKMIQAVYFSKSDRILFRASKIDAIEDSNSFRLFNKVAFHELGHAYEAQMLGRQMSQVSSVQEYDSSARKEFAGRFAARMTLVQHKNQGKGIIPKSLRQRDDDHNFISETSL
jgi:hypothetical protein